MRILRTFYFCSKNVPFGFIVAEYFSWASTFVVGSVRDAFGSITNCTIRSRIMVVLLKWNFNIFNDILKSNKVCESVKIIITQNYANRTIQILFGSILLKKT